MDISEFKKLFTAKEKSVQVFREAEELYRTAFNSYEKAIFCLFDVFKGKELPVGKIKIEPITVDIMGAHVVFDRAKLNIKDGRVVNIYFESENGHFLKYGELLSFFSSEDQIDSLKSTLESLVSKS